MASLTALVTPNAKATPYTDNFDALIAELQARGASLSNATDKVGKSQYKACVKSLQTFAKDSTSLATDLKNGVKVAKALIKAFPGDFTTNMTATAAATLTASTFGELLEAAYTGLADDVEAALAALQTTVNALPAGSAKDKALEAIAAATQALAEAENATDYDTGAKALATAIKEIAKGAKAAASGGGGGGGGGASKLSAKVIINGVTNNWVATAAGGEWVKSTGILDVGGTTGPSGAPTSQLSAALGSGYNGTTGAFALGGNVGGYFDFGAMRFYGAVSGTLNITSFSEANTTIKGTFSYTASDGTTTIQVTEGEFEVYDLTVTP
jgi:hypothetical protein